MKRLSFIGLTLCAFVVSGLIACDAETSTTKRPTRTVRSKQSNATKSSSKNYHQAGNGPQKAPDWISSQDLNVIRRFTNKPLSGFRYGNLFKPQANFIEQGEMGWKLIVNENKLSYPSTPVLSGQRIEIPLNQMPSNEFRQQASFETSKALWRLPTGAVIGKTNSWISESSYTVEILEWNVKPFQKNKSPFQIAGSATGRLVVHFLDGSGIQGWVAGRFENIPVRYMGNPSHWSQAH